MAEGQEFISKEQVKVFFIENFLGNFWELCLEAVFGGWRFTDVQDNDAGEATAAPSEKLPFPAPQHLDLDDR